MKIAIPVEDKSIESNMSRNFGRSSFFLIYDIETKEEKYLDNNAATSQGGAGVKAAQTIIDQKVDGIIVPRCGRNAADIIQRANIKLFQGNNVSAHENIEALKNNKLDKLKDIHAGFHRHGGN
ncbi:MAG: NifB/NifX family molybdenum-iron cluster-binding protein [Halanaerobiaceae bacterium]